MTGGMLSEIFRNTFVLANSKRHSCRGIMYIVFKNHDQLKSYISILNLN